MKSISALSVLALSLAFASAADASVVIDPVLMYVSNNGTVAPAFRRTYTCMIDADGNTVNKVTTGPSVRPRPINVPIAWTAKVRDAKSLGSLLASAAAGRIAKPPGHGPIGGGVTTFDGSFLTPTAHTSVKVELFSQYHYENKSAAAKKLVEFMRYNCEQQ